ncbi:MAG: hypothetical protein AB7P21_13665 [Lautropia sp.]
MDHTAALVVSYAFTAVLLLAELVMLGVRRRAAWRRIRLERVDARAATESTPAPDRRTDPR